MRVLVADDHSLFRDGIASLLEAAGFEVVGQVGDGRAAVAAVEQLCPDLVLMDLTMPELDGLEATRLIMAAHPQMRVVILTVSEDDTNLLEAVQAGAQGYLLKNLHAEEFLELLHGLPRGEAAMTRKTTSRLMAGFAELTHERAAPGETLTAREVDLLRLVAAGLSNKAIAQQLSLSENTVKYHLKNIMQKLGVQNRTEAVTRAIHDGIIIV